jgi:hypothetical protein
MKKVSTNTLGPINVEIHEDEFNSRNVIDIVRVKILRDNDSHAIFFFSVKKNARGEMIGELQPAVERPAKVPIRKVKGVFLKQRV